MNQQLSSMYAPFEGETVLPTASPQAATSNPKWQTIACIDNSTTTIDKHNDYTIRIYSSMGISAVQSRHTGAYRLWLLCRKLDNLGRGCIDANVLREAARELRISRQLYKIWLDDSLKLGIITADNMGRYWMIGTPKAARALGVVDLGGAVIIKNYRRLFRKGWKAILWGGYLLSGKQSPRTQISRYEQTRITTRTQRRYERQLKIKRIVNVAPIDSRDRTHFNGLLEFDNRVIFEVEGKLYQKLPSTRIVKKYNFSVAKRGRSDKERKQVRALCNPSGRAKQNTSRLFFENEDAAKSAVKKYRHSDDIDRPDEVFYHIEYEGLGNYDARNQWQSLPV